MNSSLILHRTQEHQALHGRSRHTGRHGLRDVGQHRLVGAAEARELHRVRDRAGAQGCDSDVHARLRPERGAATQRPW